ncbi:MAG: phosphoribosyltransferase domain-containing protein [Puniceicoccales bacterium]|jgi:xanthine phosphoribosyltransferase|nr:phosphoribosyltransferase domain-containing protein [Puniceicoccales bacterium]
MPHVRHSFDDILARLRDIQFAERFDMIVAIANGGILPAVLLQERLGVELNILRINWRDENNVPHRSAPLLLRQPDFSATGKTILLADDRVKTGSTFNLAREILSQAALIRTFAINGNADYALFNEECFPMPWHL